MALDLCVGPWSDVHRQPIKYMLFRAFECVYHARNTRWVIDFLSLILYYSGSFVFLDRSLYVSKENLSGQ